MRRYQRKPEPGVAGRCLDNRVARLDVAALLGLLNHRDTDAVFDRPSGIGQFEFQVQLARACVDVVYLEHRRLADHIQDVGIDLHGV